MTDVRIDLSPIDESWSTRLMRTGARFELSHGATHKGTPLFSFNIHVDAVDFHFVVRDCDESREAYNVANMVQNDHDALAWFVRFLPRERLLDAMSAIARTAYSEGGEDLREQFRSLLLAGDE